MITWLHGAFGAGKSSVAAELARRRPDLVPYDPELVGYLLRQVLPVPTGDFQDLPEWRELVAATAAALDAGGTRSLVTPMTLLDQRYADEVFTDEPDVTTLLTNDYFRGAVSEGQEAWRQVVAGAARNGVPVPGFASALAYYDGLRAERLPAALIQGLRDLFGAHTYRRTDKEGSFHTMWGEDGREVQV